MANWPAVASGAWAVLLPAHSIVAQQGPRDALVRAVDSLAQASLRAGPIAGMSVALVRGSDVLLAKGYGFADLENEVPATAHTVYRIGSITKQFTAAALLQLVEQGKLKLDDDIRHYLPSYDTQGYTIAVRQLLTTPLESGALPSCPLSRLESGSTCPPNRTHLTSDPAAADRPSGWSPRDRTQ
jgi:CubicO group peptidase (beta-lactamase class C family)